MNIELPSLNVRDLNNQIAVGTLTISTYGSSQLERNRIQPLVDQIRSIDEVKIAEEINKDLISQILLSLVNVKKALN